MSNSVDIDGRGVGTALSNIDIEKGGQQGPGNTNIDPSEPISRVIRWFRGATLWFSSTRQSEPPSPATTQSHWQQEEVSRIDGHPEGYPQLAAFIDSDESFLMCRRFGWLNSRVLLYRQDELVKLEETLIAMDDDDTAYDGGKTLKSREEDDGRKDIEEQVSRKTLINQIDTKLKEYHELISRVRTFVALKRPSARNFNSFKNWMIDQKPVTREEMQFIRHAGDFVALADGQEGGWFDGFVEDILTKIPKDLARKLFSGPEELAKSNDAYVHLYSRYRIDILVRLILTIITVVLLVVPTAVLYEVSGHAALKIGLIMLFTLLFSMALGILTKAKRHEMFAATAA
ncbi:hypothetical protein MMC31_007683, partial [Peltigera leucophlebia]|nr:hypothetical protein [Peltigera leucophlebia]